MSALDFYPLPDVPLHVTSPFGASESFRRAPHSGVDLRAPEGTSLYAPGAGVVIMADDDDDADDSGGLELVLKLDNGFTIGFAHLVAHIVTPGQRVEAGELLGATGNTGRSTAPHLHVSMRDPQGRRIDPLPHLRAVGASGGVVVWIVGALVLGGLAALLGALAPSHRGG